MRSRCSVRKGNIGVFKSPSGLFASRRVIAENRPTTYQNRVEDFGRVGIGGKDGVAVGEMAYRRGSAQPLGTRSRRPSRHSLPKAIVLAILALYPWEDRHPLPERPIRSRRRVSLLVPQC